MQIQNAIITGSFSYNGADLSNVTSSNAYSASLSSRTTDLESTSSVLVGASASFSSILSSVSSSQQQISSSLLQVSASYISLSGSYNVFSGSASTRITENSSSIQQVSSSQQQISASLLNVISIFATTGSNSFRETQSITGSLTVTGQIIAQTLNVQQVTSSIIYSSGSNNFGCDINSRQVFTGSFYQTGSIAVFNSCVGIGTSTPTKALEIFSNISQDGIKISGASNPRLTIIDTTNSVQFDALTTDTEAVLRTDTNHPLHLSTNGTLRLTIASTGAATFACQVNAESFYTNDTRYISNQIMSGYNANSEDSDIWINYTGYLGGTTRFRDFRIGNGKQGQIALFDGSTGAASFACSVGVGTTLSVTGATSLSCRLSVGASDQSYASIFVGGDITTGANQYAIILDPQLSGTSNSYAVFANARIKANTAVTNAFGVYIPSAEKISGATITNNYALYIANQTSGATLNYSIYSSGGLNYFGGCVGIGMSAPTTLLHICQIGQPATPLGLYSTMTLQTDSQANYQRIRFDRDSCPFWGVGVEGASSTNDFMISGLVGGKSAGTWSDSVFRIKNSNGAVLVNTNSIGSYGKFNSYTNGADPAGRFIGGSSNSEGAIVLMVDKYSSTNTTSQWFLGFTINNQTIASGVITANGASQAAFSSWSDRRLKQNITDLPNQLSNIMALRPVEFDYIESEGGGHQTSFIAQEFETIYPDAVGERPDGMKTLTGWGKTEAILVKAIQEQQCTICSQASMINTLKTCLGII